jgi:hypothetical protein
MAKVINMVGMVESVDVAVVDVAVVDVAVVDVAVVDVAVVDGKDEVEGGRSTLLGGRFWCGRSWCGRCSRSWCGGRWCHRSRGGRVPRVRGDPCLRETWVRAGVVCE